MILHNREISNKQGGTEEYSYIDTLGNKQDIEEMHKEFREIRECKELYSEGQGYEEQLRV